MKISLEWLRRWLPDLKSNGNEVGDALTSLGIEVEGSISFNLPRNNLVVGEVESFEQHPNADRLRLCRVAVGGENSLQIVCGAKNFTNGDRVAVALPGCRLPNGITIGTSNLRGKVSEGMMCSCEELRLPGNGDGIMVLSRRWPIGTPLCEVFPTGDTVLDLSVGANRGDCMSHLGIARELAAYFHLKLPENVYDPGCVQLQSNGGDDFLLRDLLLESQNCYGLMAWSIGGVRICQSPEWLSWDLERIGMRSINVAVDVTNWLMADCGQPLHAFDAAKIRGRTLRIRQAVNGETMVALNHRSYDLSDDMLILSDLERPLAIAGTMGSVDAEVDENTQNIVLECAAFNGASIQMTSKKLGLISDSSQRFARGTDGDAMEYCARKAVKMIAEICGGVPCVRPQTVGSVKPNKKNVTIALDGDFLRKKCAMAVSDEAIEKALGSSHFDLKKTDGGWSVAVPPFRRRDVGRPIDLVEEFVRYRGLEELAGGAPKFISLERRDERSYTFAVSASAHLIANGFNECYNYSTVAGCGDESSGELAIANPLNGDQGFLRSSLLPGVISAAAAALRNGSGAAKFFEVGRVWVPHEGKLYEALAVGWVHFSGKLEGDWYRLAQPDFYGMKAIGKQLAALAAIAVGDVAFAPSQCRLGEDNYWAQHGQLSSDGHDLRLGLLSETACCEDFDLPNNCDALCGGELRILPALLNKELEPKQFRQFANFPCAVRDLAVTVESSLAAEEVRLEVERCLATAYPENAAVERVRIFDTYGPGFSEAGEKNVAIRLTFCRSDGTLTEDEIGRIFDAVIQQLEQKFTICRKNATPKAEDPTTRTLT